MAMGLDSCYRFQQNDEENDKIFLWKRKMTIFLPIKESYAFTTLSGLLLFQRF